MPSFQAYCSACGITVSASTILGGDELKQALANNVKIRVMHTVALADGTRKDHLWELGSAETDNLRQYLQH